MTVLRGPGSSEGSRGASVVLLTSLMVSFISCWRAAAVVLADQACGACSTPGVTENEYIRHWPPVAKKEGVKHLTLVLVGDAEHSWRFEL